MRSHKGNVPGFTKIENYVHIALLVLRGPLNLNRHLRTRKLSPFKFYVLKTLCLSMFNRHERETTFDVM